MEKNWTLEDWREEELAGYVDDELNGRQGRPVYWLNRYLAATSDKRRAENAADFRHLVCDLMPDEGGVDGQELGAFVAADYCRRKGWPVPGWINALLPEGVLS